MKATLKHFGKMSFEAVADSGHRVVVSASPEVGGEGDGARPMEMVLIGLGGCSGIDVMLILRKSRQLVASCEIELRAERADAVPAVFTRIHAHFRIGGDDLDRRKVARAVSLSIEKYCSVARMLEPSVAITHGFEIVAPPHSPEAASEAAPEA
ncbi:MAG: OsmC family protein [bacterium]